MEVVGDAWSWLILREAVFHRVRRFGEFQARLGISRATLSARLGQLGRGGVLVRESSTGQDYQLTDRGEDLFGCLMAALRWGDRWRPLPEPTLSVTHLACGNRIAAELRCRACGQVITARDVRAERGDARPPAAIGGDVRRRTPDFELLERNQPSSIAYTLTMTGDWWSGLIVREAFFGVRRFDDLQHSLGVGPNILSARLRRLVGHGFLRRAEYQSWPVRHEYLLTEKGRDFYPLPLAMATWGRRWLPPADGEPRLTHSCGHDVQAMLCCEACGREITRGDVTTRHDH
ncbi:winged helix-turn-helix transcriptional regulator [Pseudonocardia acaciae]|uniref:winged helix-turn-helix transcriptional regulator n=1 Tax=Pseudonocardia acaciae TaxID=551276 RepID=UPI000688ADFE|nr:helix-turn-helix domain-containing protein [Pseudonocardia acaciae]